MPDAQASHSWWDDVQHLRPEASEGRTRLRAAADPADARSEAPAAQPGPHRARSESADARPGSSAPRARRPRPVDAEPRLSRAHAAGFADALDIDGAFGTPRRRFARDAGESQVIVLDRTAGQPRWVGADELLEEEPAPTSITLVRDPEPEPRFDDEADELDAGRTDRADPSGFVEPTMAEQLAAIERPENWDTDAAGRRTVRITGRPVHDRPAPRRLRELERRPRRNPMERVTARPDRIAMYAVLLGILLVVIAAASSSAHPA